MVVGYKPSQYNIGLKAFACNLESLKNDIFFCKYYANMYTKAGPVVAVPFVHNFYFGQRATYVLAINNSSVARKMFKQYRVCVIQEARAQKS